MQALKLMLGGIHTAEDFCRISQHSTCPPADED